MHGNEACKAILRIYLLFPLAAGAVGYFRTDTPCKHSEGAKMGWLLSL